MPLTIVRQDITKMKVDVIVNAANTNLLRGGGVCGAIFRAAGGQELQAACDELSPIKTGEAVITPGFALQAKYIIHAAGPIYHSFHAKQSEILLRLAYTNSLSLAAKTGCQSIAFPLISSGIYGYPKEQALRAASDTIQEFLAHHEMDVYLAVFDGEAFAISEKLMGDVASYIDEHFVQRHTISDRQSVSVNLHYSVIEPYFSEAPVSRDLSSMPKAACPASIEDLFGNLDEPFSATLLRLIDIKGKTDVQTYKKANLDRKLFSKIRSVKGYMPSKRTVLALAIALELSRDETDDLLERAGFALSRSQKFDVIVEYFIISGQYNIFKINEVLFKYDQPLLGG
ncbi:MAG: macro domain-containing protein [Clostridiales bacterium]|nr:macro domain-containing protein [Clostridiales bacterium]